MKRLLIALIAITMLAFAGCRSTNIGPNKSDCPPGDST